MQEDLEHYRDCPIGTVAIGAAALAYHAETFGPPELAESTVAGALHDIGYALANMKVEAVSVRITIMHRSSGVTLRARVDLAARGVI